MLCTRQAACTSAVLPGEATLRVTGCPQELVPSRSPNLCTQIYSVPAEHTGDPVSCTNSSYQ